MAPFTERQIIIMNNLQKLLTVLKQSDTPLSSRQLSSLLSVSDRSVRNYIKELRNAGEQITANENGYLWIGIKNDEPESPGNKSQALFAFATPEERINYIIESPLRVWFCRTCPAGRWDPPPGTECFPRRRTRSRSRCETAWRRTLWRLRPGSARLRG